MKKPLGLVSTRHWHALALLREGHRRHSRVDILNDASNVVQNIQLKKLTKVAVTGEGITTKGTVDHFTKT